MKSIHAISLGVPKTISLNVSLPPCFAYNKTPNPALYGVTKIFMPTSRGALSWMPCSYNRSRGHNQPLFGKIEDFRKRGPCTKLAALGATNTAQPGTSSFQGKQSDNQGKQSGDQSTQARPVFPFTAIVGQEEMKLALILNVIDPKIGGVMIMGDRGTGKSTTVRALVDLLPEIEVVRDDPFNSDPFDLEVMSKEVREKKQKNISIETIKRKILMVDLPLGATEDRVCGTIDIEKALTEGVKAFEPGLLAKANRGILYVDEVNLLDDHLVDVLLDSAASGWNTVERESISISHPARFILVGSGNPEEGELRPQLLDRFGMHAQIGTVKEPHLRVKIVEQRAQFDESPTTLTKQYGEAQKELRDKIKAARELRPKVEMEYGLRMKVSEVCSELSVDGLRGDIVTNRASQAIAAFEERNHVTPEDIFRVIPLCLRHRLRKDPLESIDSGDKVKDVFKRVFGV